MIFEECHFTLGSFDSRKYGLIFAHADTSAITMLSGEISSVTVYNKGNRSRRLIGTDYENSAISFNAEIVTDHFTALTQQERREVEKGLFHHQEYRKLFIDLYDDYFANSYELVDGMQKRCYLNCRFMNPTKIEDGFDRVVGYKFTIECDSHLAWQEPITKIFDLNHSGGSSNSVISINVDTDITDYTYPKVTVLMGSTGGDITISNNSDDTSRLTSFVGLSPSETVVMRGDGINYISGDNYQKFNNKNFVRLLDGVNNISVIGNVKSVTFEFQNRRYL